MSSLHRKQAKEIVGKNMREALSKIKKEFGHDAIIHAQEKKNGKIYILASGVDDDITITNSNPKIKEYQKNISKLDVTDEKIDNKNHNKWLVEKPFVERMEHEIADIKNLLSDQLAGVAWQKLNSLSAIKISVLKRFCGLNFAPALIMQYLEKLPDELYLNQAVAFVLNSILESIEFDDEFLSNGLPLKIFHGPSGAGKTKLIFNLLLELERGNSATDVAIIVAANNKLTALEESKIYQRVFGAPTVLVETRDTLLSAVDNFRKHENIIVDITDSDNGFVETLHCLNEACDFNYILPSTHSISSTTIFHNNLRYENEYLSVTKTDEVSDYGNVISLALQRGAPLRFENSGSVVGSGFSLLNKEYLQSKLINQLCNDVYNNDDELLAFKFSEIVYHGKN